MTQSKSASVAMLLVLCACASSTQDTVSQMVYYHRELKLSDGCESPSKVADSILTALEFNLVTSTPNELATDFRTGPNRSRLKADFLTKLAATSSSSEAARGALKVKLSLKAVENPKNQEHTTTVDYELVTRVTEPRRGEVEYISSSRGLQLADKRKWDIYEADVRTIFTSLIQACGAVS